MNIISNKRKKLAIGNWQLAIVSIFMALIGCKMNYSFTGASIPVEAKTLSIQYFPNYAPLAPTTYGQTFTDALRTILSNQTNLGLTSKNGDLGFEGSVTGYFIAPSAIQSNDQASSNRLTITVNVKFENKYDKVKNFETTFSRFKDYPSSENLSTIEAGLIEEINKQLVQDIFNKALNNW